MSVSDPIADMLTRIRNAHLTGADHVVMPHSKMKGEIARLLKREGFIENFVVEGDSGRQRVLRLFLKYHGDRKPTITGVRRMSRPGLRHYVTYANIPRVLGGMGVAILSTSAGVCTDQEARERHMGGEVLCYVW